MEEAVAVDDGKVTMEEAVTVDDGRDRTGTLWSATAHALTTMVGTGVLALPWVVSQLGWILGSIAIILFASVTYYIVVLLCDCYRSPNPITGSQNYTYMDAIQTCLGEIDVLFCGIAQYAVLWGTMVGYSITLAMCVLAIRISHCVHRWGRNASCNVSAVKYVMIYTIIQVFFVTVLQFGEGYFEISTTRE
ncbi:amino acid permease 5-like [Dioscorea cayenensis subsp. rotundata]|uniref:Amino acid permease 5-like n=1 Tax=Dioscorea cayennensis subsp. rotundata TaxID=55577 RepID=A0AB40B4G7_DIOCR|nr:amino acid permease 5-like [Dioscorea cayenensis subsp. rotundata]